MNLDEAHKRISAAYEAYCRRKKRKVSFAQVETYTAERLASLMQGQKWDSELAKRRVAEIEAVLER